MNAQSFSRRGFLTRSGLILGTVAGATLVASCNDAARQANTPQGTAGGGAAGKDDVSFQLGWLISEGQLGEAVALAKGYYQDNGISFSIQPGGPSIDGVSLVASGRSQMGEVSSSPSLMIARSQGIPVKTFAVGVQEHPYAYVSLPDKPVREPKDLVGKRVGTQATGQILLSALLAKNDIDPGDVEVVIIGADVTPLTTGQVDVWTGWLSNVTAMQPLDGKFESMRLWDAGIHLYAYPYYTTDEVLKNQHDLVAKWTAATAQGWAFAKDNLQEAAKMVVDLQPTLKAEDIAAQGEVLVKYAYNDETAQNGWGTMSREMWQSQLDTWDQLDQFKGAAPGVDDIATFDVLEATKDVRKV
jgi:NitT/TauT family transport system substrate-binding protein